MIIAKKRRVTLIGKTEDIAAETLRCLKALYNLIKKDHGEEIAKRTLALNIELFSSEYGINTKSYFKDVSDILLKMCEEAEEKQN